MGIMRGQRCVRSLQSPAKWAGKPWEAVPVGIASLVCPAGHGDEVKGRKALEGMKKKGAGATRCNFLTPQKLDCTPKIFGFVVFVFRNVLSAPLVRMRSAVRIRPAAPTKSTQTTKFECFLLFYCNSFDKSVIVPKRPAGKKLTQKPTPTRKNRPDRELSLPGFLYGLPHDLGGLADAFLVSVGVHPQRHSFVAVAQGLAD